MRLSPLPVRRQQGLSLVEMMVGITIGLLALVAMASVYLNSIAGSRTASAANQLNQSLRGVMDIMVNDIRRAGYWGTPTEGLPNPFQQATTDMAVSNLATGRDCIVYSYDATHAGGTAGTVDAGIDFAGFQLNASGVLQVLNPAGLLADTATACGNLSWLDLSDARAIEITALTFDLGGDTALGTEGSKCIAFERAGYKSDDPTTYTQWEATSTKTPACKTTSPYAPGAPSPFPDAATHTFVEARLVNIVLRGRSRLDPTIPAQEIREAVLVRSNRVLNP